MPTLEARFVMIAVTPGPIASQGIAQQGGADSRGLPCCGCAWSSTPRCAWRNPAPRFSNDAASPLHDVKEVELRTFLLFRRPELRPDRNRLRPILLPLLADLHPELSLAF